MTAGVLSGVRVDQIGMIVRDLPATLRYYTETLGIGPWKVWTYDERILRTMRIDGADAPYAMWLALCGSGPQLELIQPLRGDTAYQRFLDEHGEGVQHFGMFVDEGTFARYSRRLAEEGFAAALEGTGQGADGSGQFVYYDTRSRIGVMFELGVPPAVRHPPERIWTLP